MCMRENSSFAPLGLDHFPRVPTAYESVTKSVPSAKSGPGWFHFRLPGTSVPGFHMPPLRGWISGCYCPLLPLNTEMSSVMMLDQEAPLRDRSLSFLWLMTARLEAAPFQS
jgi:hypothetical protein